MAAVFLLLLGLALAAPFLFDGEALANRARDKARASLQRELQVRDVQLRLLPLPRLKAASLSLSSPPWASRPQLLQAEDVEASLEWLPLLHGRLVVTGIAARQLRLNLETDGEGRNSWDFPSGPESTLDWSRLRHAEVDALDIWRQQGKQAASAWQLLGLKADGQAGWKDLDLSTRLLANGTSMQFALKLADASGLGKPGASSEGMARLEIQGASLQLTGRLPLSPGLESYAFKARLQADSLAAVQRFAATEFRVPTVPLELSATLRREQQSHVIEALDIQLGRQRFAGQGQLLADKVRWRLQGELTGERLEWAQVLLDLGFPAPPEKPENELLPIHRLGWAQLAGPLAMDADIDTRFATLLTRGGLQLKQWHSRLLWDRNSITLADTRFELLGGKGSARVQLRPRREELQAQLQLQHLMLQEWFRRRPKHVDMVSDGPMDLKADLRSRGKSWKELAANVSGPLSIRIGAMNVHSKKAREAEAMLVGLMPAFSEDKAEEVRVACLASELRFENGRAQSKQAVGVRSQSSKLLLAGDVDLRAQSVNLGGRVRAAEGATLGIATIAGDVRIAGPLAKPEISVEPVGVLARVGAAIATAGLSVVATAAYDAATSNEDPCVLAARGEASRKPGPAKPAARAPARTADTR